MSEPTKQSDTETKTTAEETVATDVRSIYVPDYGVTVEAASDEEAVKLAKKLASKKEDK